MIRLTLIAAVGLTLAGCGTTRIVNHYIPVTVEGTFYDPNLCAWPKIADHIVEGTDLEAAGYDLEGYRAYRCERDARLAAGRRQAEIAKDIEARD